ncbi:MAG: MBL fold metallo-hydrolase [Polyangiaceae bacterium]|nr:MBL fold metallo-hydrolase [Polyangiaceae bacterium]MCB9609943.1 MBL fold metallo-hydrolase [Polyangiaceae bacterium]
MKVHHICATTLCPLSKRLVNGSGSAFERGTMVCHCWVVESKSGLILVDTGVGRDDLKDVNRRLGAWFRTVVGVDTDPSNTAFSAVERLGFDPKDVRHVIPTHLDLDHAGGLPDFPWADVHIFRPEYEAALHPPTHRESLRYRPPHWAHHPKWDVRDVDGDEWFGFQGVRAVDSEEDVLLIPLQGHTRGHCGVAVRSETGWLLHAGDAYFHQCEMQSPPKATPGLRLFQRIAAIDNELRLANQERLRHLVRDHHAEVTVHSAHCPREFKALSGAARVEVKPEVRA